MISQADQCLANGAKVVLVTSLDTGSGCKIIENAQARGAKVIDYDRLNTGCKGADYYVSFDNPVVGKFMGQGVLAAMKAKGLFTSGKKPVIAYLNGGPTDNNSKLFKQGYAGVLDPLIKAGKAAKGPDQGVPGWDNQKARTIFEQMLVKTGNKIDAVAAANDGLANAVVTALKAKKLQAIPLSGQDATAQGAQNIISGWQSGTVHKPAYVEAKGAVAVAVALLAGGKPKTNGTTNNGVRNVPSFLATPIWITKKNINVLYKDGSSEEVRRVHRHVQDLLLGITHLGWGGRAGDSPTRRHRESTRDRDHRSGRTRLHQHCGADARGAQHLQELRLGPGPDRRRLRGAGG